ncbi:MAG: metal-sulfur cluster assembly factor [Conexivisphaera sp.]
MALTQEQKEEIRRKVVEALKEVYDPEIPVNVWDLGLIEDIRVNDDGFVDIKMMLTALGCPVAASIAYVTEATVWDKVKEAKGVNVEIVWDHPWSPDRVTPEGREQLKVIYGYDIVEDWKAAYQYQSQGSGESSGSS